MSDQADTVNRKELTLSDHELTVSGLNRQAFLGRLAELRDALGHDSWRAFSAVAGISKPAIEKWRRGDAAPFRSTLVKIAERTGARLEWLETGQGEMLSPQAAPPAEAAPPARPAAPPAEDHARLLQLVSLEDLVVAYDHARDLFARRGVPAPDSRKLLALTLSLYDAAMETLSEPDAPAPPAQNPPPEQT